jgi:hypothetical protein
VASLLDKLREAVQTLDVQFQPSANEVQALLGGLIHFVEHGDEFLKAAEAGVNDVTQLVHPQPKAEEPPADQPAEPEKVDAPESDQDLEAHIQDLQAQLDARRATSQRTTVDHQTDVDPAGAVA